MATSETKRVPSRKAVIQRLRSLQNAGITHIPKASQKSESPQTSMDTQQMTDDNLEVIAADVAQCTRCAELAQTRTQTVFGAGNPKARLVFLGEAPGADEDRQGIPFVGRAGQLLTKIIEACTLSRDKVYILNILKCRP
ncbi:MAG: uracil-DNA glycosylase, partial [Pirellulales bacterium]|nr:uracil-DNA glycosylase [Pirellulales bacterium]